MQPKTTAWQHSGHASQHLERPTHLGSRHELLPVPGPHGGAAQVAHQRDGRRVVLHHGRQPLEAVCVCGWVWVGA